MTDTCKTSEDEKIYTIPEDATSVRLGGHVIGIVGIREFYEGKFLSPMRYLGTSYFSAHSKYGVTYHGSRVLGYITRDGVYEHGKSNITEPARDIQAVIRQIEDLPLGYKTEQEHKLLEDFSDRVLVLLNRLTLDKPTAP